MCVSLSLSHDTSILPDGSPTASVFGLAAVDAYLAYNVSDMLDIAISMWNQTSVYQLTKGDAEREFLPSQNARIPASCHDSR